MKLKAILNVRRQLEEATDLLSELRLCESRANNNLRLRRGHANIDTQVTLLGKRKRQKLVQFQIQHSAGDEPLFLG